MLDRLAGIGLLALRVREELHRLDVGIAVDDPPGDRRARVGELLGRLADPRHRPGDQPEVEPEPDDERQREPRVGVRQQPERADEVDAGVDQRVEGLERRLSDRRRGLHHPVGDPSGEVVLEPADRLAQHVPMRAPAHDGADVRQQRLVEERRREGLDDRPRHQDEDRDGRELHPVPRPDLGRGGVAEHVDDAAGVPDQPDLDDRDQEDRQHGPDHDPARRRQVVAQERPEPRRRRVGIRIGRVGVDERLEVAEHGSRPEAMEGTTRAERPGPGRSRSNGNPDFLHQGLLEGCGRLNTAKDPGCHPPTPSTSDTVHEPEPGRHCGSGREGLSSHRLYRMPGST
jgi:hypothetical protein